MSVLLEIRDGAPVWYLSSDIWLVSQNPNGPLVSSPVVDQPHWVWARVRNNGTSPVQDAQVRFYWADPSTVMSRSSAHVIGTSLVALQPGEVKEVLCVSPWIPSLINGGHECLIVEAFSPTDPLQNAGDAVPFDPPNDRHVAQRNLQLVSVDLKDLQKKSFVFKFAARVSEYHHSETAVLRVRPLPIAATLKGTLADREIPEVDLNKELAEKKVNFWIAPTSEDICAKKDIRDALHETKISNSAAWNIRVELPADVIVSDKKSSGLLFCAEQLVGDKVVGGVGFLVQFNVPKLPIEPIIAKLGVPTVSTGVPVSVPIRPYAIIPYNGLMTVDGIFVSNLGNQYIQATHQEMGATDIANVKVYIEGISDPAIVVAPATSLVTFPSVKKSSQFHTRHLADFTNAKPGEALVSFIFEADGYVFQRILKKIFITTISYHAPSKIFSILIPQGTLQVHLNRGIAAKKDCCKDRDPAFVLLENFSYNFIPSPAYKGQLGPLPFQDPLQKVILALLALLIALGGAIYDAVSSGSSGGGGGGSTSSNVLCFDEVNGQVIPCGGGTESSITTSNAVTASIFAAAATVAVIAAASDGVDPHLAGQKNTPPSTNTELTVAEMVKAEINYTAAPSPGVKFPITMKWAYTRSTTVKNYDYSQSDDRENTHVLKGYTVKVPTTWDRQNGAMRVQAQFLKPTGEVYRGGELYVRALLNGPDAQIRVFDLRDDGLLSDDVSIDGWYSGVYNFRRKNIDERPADPPGLYYLLIFAQDVNMTKEGVNPYDAAKNVGGMVVTDQLHLSFNSGEPCRLKHDAVINVI